MQHQADDLTAERAAALLEKCMKMGWAFNGSYTEGQGHYVLAQALKTARQEALREGAKVAREFPWEQPSAHADPLRQARCRGNREASSDIAAALDRLASEGG